MRDHDNLRPAGEGLAKPAPAWYNQKRKQPKGGDPMGLLKAAHGAVHSVLQEQWKEFFCCSALPDDTLLVRGRKRIGARSANDRADDEVVTNGSVICVADGQCVLVVKQGKVIDVCTEPGEHIFEDPEQGGLKGFFREVGNRIAFGGGDIQPTVYRVYYMNTKEITGLAFRTDSPVAVRMRDERTGLDLDVSASVSGCFSYRVSDPVKLYRTIIGNVSGRFTRDRLTGHLRSELMKYLQPAMEQLTAEGVRPYQLTGHVPELCAALREKMNGGWCGEHGVELWSLAVDGCSVQEADTVQSAQSAAILRDPDMAAAKLTQAVSEAMGAAAAAPGPKTPPPAVLMRQPPKGSAWRCACGTVSDRAFGPDCGRPRPEEWICVCGSRNTGRFCRDCGEKRPPAQTE